MKAKHMTTHVVHASAHLPVSNDSESMPIYQTSVDIEKLDAFFHAL